MSIFNIGHDDTGIINIENNEIGLKMLDKLSRLNDDRRIDPLDQFDNIIYPHRYTYETYNLLIGDTYFMIPPEFIAVTSDSTHQSIVTLRQENTQKMKGGYHKRMVMIDLVFNGSEQLNGYKVDGPEGHYYVDGLRQLLAQFKCTPFLPITNELINGMYGIFTVALQSITIQTMPGFPDTMQAHITLQEVNMFPYLQMPDLAFKYMIDWDLFRFYYQRLLTEDHEYKKLQSLPANKEHNKFKISILDESVFNSGEATKYNLLQIIRDEKIVKTEEDGVTLDKTNYSLFVDSETDNVHISSFQCNYSNILTNVQLSDAGTPTIQYMGGLDTIYNIVFETTDYSVVQALEQCQIKNDILTRGNKKLCSLGFIKLESELVEFTGSLFVMFESVMTNTVPGFPGLYNVQIQCVAYDIAQSEREELHGFLPFECNKDGKCGKYVSGEGFVSDHVHSEQAIDQSMDGLLVKIKQDSYAEWKLRKNIEVYPDLRLPTYNEVNEVITKIIAFREKHNISQLKYTKYPMAPSYMLHGLPLNTNINFDFSNESQSIIDTETVSELTGQYDIYVDPDFYVFYPSSYISFNEEDEGCYGAYSAKQRNSVSRTINSQGYNSNLIEQFIAVAESFHGHKYVFGAEGGTDDNGNPEVDELGRKTFDCSGLVTYCLKEIGVMPADQFRFTVTTITTSDLFIEVPWDQKRRGDILCKSDLEHVVIYKGNNMITEAANKEDGVREHTLWFSHGRCFRPKAFTQGQMAAPSDASDNASNVTINNTSKQVWSILKSYGLSDIAAAGILGNAYAESSMNSANLQGSYEKDGKYELPGEYTDQTYTAVVDSGKYTIQEFSSDEAGYGLFQFTYSGYKFELYQVAKYRGVSISDVKLQVDCMIDVITKNGIFEKINSATTIQEASTIFLYDYENPRNKESKIDERAAYSRAYYNEYAGTIPAADMQLGSDVLTQAEFETICRVIMAETQGEGEDAEKAMAQLIYDRLTHPEKAFGSLGNILNGNPDILPSAHQGALNDTIEKNVKAVFCENDKYWKDYQVLYFLAPDDTHGTINEYDKAYDNLGTVGFHTFWGKKVKGEDIKYSIVNYYGLGAASKSGYQGSTTVTHDAITISSVKKFGQPAYVKTDAIKYSNTWKIWGEGERNIARNELNSAENIFNSSFCDEVQYCGRGKLVRAFPTYLFCILDDQSQWYDGRKLWSNYYVYKSIVDIAVHSTNDMPTETATITVTNSYHNLDRIQGGLSSYSLSEDDGYNQFQQWWYSWTHTMPGFGPKLTDKLIKLHQVICNQALLREGARIHLRMGYGSDPLSLAPVMNGHISDITLGDQITMIVTSDGNELIHSLVYSGNKTKNTNDGWLGLFGLGENQEASNIIADVMCKRSSWVTHLAGTTFEASKYGIEHFGLYFNKTLIGPPNGVAGDAATILESANSIYNSFNPTITQEVDSFIDFVTTAANASATAKDPWQQLGQYIGAIIAASIEYYKEKAGKEPDDTDWTDVVKEAFYSVDLNASDDLLINGEEIVKAIATALFDYWGWFEEDEEDATEDGGLTESNPVSDAVSDIWDAHQENYDLLKNIYKANYQRQHYIYTTAELIGTEYNEKNVIFNRYNMTPWDVFQVCTQQAPEYILKTTYHQFDSRLFFGLPFWMEKYRYDYLNKTVYEECKSAAQVHFIDSMDCIIDNQVRVTSKFSNTNVKVLYTSGSDLVSTDVIHSDDSIDNSKQKTTIIDTAITQDALGPDQIWDFFGYSVGADSARRVGISNLLYGWQQQYQGQLLLMGHPGLKPHDYMMVNDTFANLYGLCIVRETTHSFNVNTGFTTSVVPGMIGFSTDENSGLIQTSQNYLMLLNCFSSYTQVRKNLRDNYEKNIALISELENAQNQLKMASTKLSALVHTQDVYETSSNITSVVGDIGNVIIAVNTMKVIKNLHNTVTVAKLIDDFKDAYKKASIALDTAKGVTTVYKGIRFISKSSKGIKAILNTLKVATIGGGTLGGGWPGIIAAVIWTAVDILLDEVFEWLSNRNVCTLLPLWWEGYPFVSGVKDGEKILLTSSNAVGTDENDQSDGIERVENEE